MPAEHEIAASAQLTRIEFVSPWPAPLRVSRVRKWLGRIADAWREGMALYVRACLYRGGGWFE